MSQDTVADAAASPDLPQDYAAAGLREDEYRRIREILSRRPTETELAMYAVMWSEHCSYKSSKVHLAYFGETTTEAMRAGLLAGIGENAGVVEIGDGWAATFKFESHNHPSYIDPVAGAATGIGGCVRDILAMGARPVAVAGDLFVGDIDAPDTARILTGATEGLAAYGRGLDLPHITGGVTFDAAYAGNPLVNAGCVGVLRSEALRTAKASGVGNVVVVYGGLTGTDGVGAAARASAATEDDAVTAATESTVPKGDPELEKRLIAATLEAFDADLIRGISDLGAAGLSCATSELAAAGDGGMDVALDEVPLREEGMSGLQIFCSESQERMCAVLRPGDVDDFRALCARHDIPFAVLGTVTDTGRLRVTYRGETIVDVPPRSVAHDGPVYRRPIEKPVEKPVEKIYDASRADALPGSGGAAAPPAATGSELAAQIIELAGSANLASRALVTDRLSGYGSDGRILAAPAGAGMVRIAPETARGVALASGANPHATALDPAAGTRLALGEAYRKVAATGARPVAVTNCLCFGSPEDPGVMWQFREAVHGLADGCAELGIPVTGGNVSFYNQTGHSAIYPTPIVGVLGVIDDVATHIPATMGAGPLPEMLFLLGDTADEPGGSEWARVIHGENRGTPSAPNLAAEQRLAQAMAAAAAGGLVAGSRALTRGGLAQALVELCLISGCGAAITLPPLDPAVALFSESAARVLVSVPVPHLVALSELCESLGVPTSALGTVTARRPVLEISGVGEIPLEDLRTPWESALPTRFA